MADIKLIFELAKEKKVDVLPYIAQGVPLDTIQDALQQYEPPPSGVVGGFVGGAKGATLATLGGLAELAQLPNIASSLLEGAQKSAIPANAGLPAKVSYALGSLVPIIASAIATKGASAYAIPAILGASAVGQIHHEAPERGWLPALAGGAGEGALFALLPSVSSVGGTIGRAITSRLPRAAQAAIGKVPEIMKRGAAFPAITAGTHAIRQTALGEPVTLPSASDILADYVAGIITEVPNVYLSRMAKKAAAIPETSEIKSEVTAKAPTKLVEEAKIEPVSSPALEVKPEVKEAKTALPEKPAPVEIKGPEEKVITGKEEQTPFELTPQDLKRPEKTDQVIEEVKPTKVEEIKQEAVEEAVPVETIAPKSDMSDIRLSKTNAPYKTKSGASSALKALLKKGEIKEGEGEIIEVDGGYGILIKKTEVEPAITEGREQVGVPSDPEKIVQAVAETSPLDVVPSLAPTEVSEVVKNTVRENVVNAIELSPDTQLRKEDGSVVTSGEQVVTPSQRFGGITGFPVLDSIFKTLDTALSKVKSPEELLAYREELLKKAPTDKEASLEVSKLDHLLETFSPEELVNLREVYSKANKNPKLLQQEEGALLSEYAAKLVETRPTLATSIIKELISSEKIFADELTPVAKASKKQFAGSALTLLQHALGKSGDKSFLHGLASGAYDEAALKLLSSRFGNKKAPSILKFLKSQAVKYEKLMSKEYKQGKKYVDSFLAKFKDTEVPFTDVAKRKLFDLIAEASFKQGTPEFTKVDTVKKITSNFGKLKDFYRGLLDPSSSALPGIYEIGRKLVYRDLPYYYKSVAENAISKLEAMGETGIAKEARKRIFEVTAKEQEISNKLGLSKELSLDTLTESIYKSWFEFDVRNAEDKANKVNQAKQIAQRILDEAGDLTPTVGYFPSEKGNLVLVGLPKELIDFRADYAAMLHDMASLAKGEGKLAVKLTEFWLEFLKEKPLAKEEYLKGNLSSTNVAISRYIKKFSGEKIYLPIPEKLVDVLVAKKERGAKGLTEDFFSAWQKELDTMYKAAGGEGPISIINNAYRKLLLGDNWRQFVKKRSDFNSLSFLSSLNQMKFSRVATSSELFRVLSTVWLKHAGIVHPEKVKVDNKLQYLVSNIDRIANFLPYMKVVDNVGKQFSPEWVSKILAHDKIPEEIKQYLTKKVDEHVAKNPKKPFDIYESIIALRGYLLEKESVLQGTEGKLPKSYLQEREQLYSTLKEILVENGVFTESEAEVLTRTHFNFRALDNVEMILNDTKLLNQDVTKIHELGASILARVLGNEYKLDVLNDKHAISAMFDKLGVKFVGAVDRFAKTIFVLPHSYEIKDIAVTVGHEAFHVLWDAFKPIEKNILLQRYKNLETAADAFGKYVADKVHPNNSIIRRVFDKVWEFVHKVANLLQGYGFSSTKDVFERAWLGEYIEKIKSPEELATIPDGAFESNYDLINRRFSFRDIAQAIGVKDDKVAEVINKVYDVSKEYLASVRKHFPKAFNHVILPLYNKSLRPVYSAAKKASIEATTYALKHYSKLSSLLKEIKSSSPEEFKLLQEMKTYLDEEGIPLYDEIPGNFKKELEYVAKQHGIDMSKVNVTRVENALREIKVKMDKDFRRAKGDVAAYQHFALLDLIEGAAKNIPATEVTEIFTKIHMFRQDMVLALHTIIKGPESVFNPDVPLEKLRTKEPLTIGSIQLKESKHYALQHFYKTIAKELDSLAEKYEYNAPPEVLHQLTQLSTRFYSAANRAKQLTKDIVALHKTWYFPRVRNGGDYVLNVVAKNAETGEYSSIFWWDTKPKLIASKTRQYADLNIQTKHVLKQLKEQNISEDKIAHINTDDPRWVQIKKEAPTLGAALSAYLTRIGKDPDYVVFTGIKEKLSESAFDKLSFSEALEVIHNLAAKGGDVFQHLDKLESALFESYAEKSYSLARKLRRNTDRENVVKGYKEDLIEVLDQHNASMSNHFANANFNFLMRELKRSPDFVQYLQNPETRDLINRQVDMFTAPSNRIARAMFSMRNLVTMYYLAYRASTAFWNLLQPYLMYLPELAQFVKTKANKPYTYSLLSAYKDYHVSVKKYFPVLRALQKIGVFTPVMDKGMLSERMIHVDRLKFEDATVAKELSKLNLPKEEVAQVVRYLDRLEEAGVLESSLMNMIRMESGIGFGKVIRKITDHGMLPFRLTENTSRILASLSLRDVYKRYNKVADEKLVDLNAPEFMDIVNFIGKTFGDYSRLNRLHWTNPSKVSGALTTPMMSLKGYSLHFLSYLAEALGERQFGKFAATLGTLSLFGGMSSLPLVNGIMDNMEKIAKRPLRLELANKIAEWSSPTIANLLIKGVPAALLNVDFSGSLRADIPLPSELSYKSIADTYFGVYGTFFERLGETANRIEGGDYLGALATVLPLGISMPLKAYKLSTKGLTSKYGKQILDYKTRQPYIFDSPEEIVMISLGFRPVTLANIQDKRFFLMKFRESVNEEKRNIFAKLRRAYSDADYETMEEVYGKISEFNQKYIEYAPIITPISDRSIKSVLSNKGDIYTGMPLME